MKAYIDPRSTVNYSTYYIQGLYDFLGKRNVSFSSKHFKELKEIDMLMAFVLIIEDKKTKFIIDYRDQDDVIEDAYSWTDFYAKINVSAATKNTGKLINIPPAFAIRIWNPFELTFHLCKNFLDAKIIDNRNHPNIHLRPKRWTRNYICLIKRQTLKSYLKKADKPDESNYIFFVATWWQGQNKTNLYRKQYMLSCSQEEKIKFEGGFFVPEDTEAPSGIPKTMVFNTFLPNKQYLKKMKKSVLAFNTPAVHNCHGWKLGEFWCMGKAIISTPLVNKLPFPLEHGEDIYFVNSENEIAEAVSTLLTNEEKRKNLEKKSKAYYEKYASPLKVIEYIFSHQ